MNSWLELAVFVGLGFLVRHLMHRGDRKRQELVDLLAAHRDKYVTLGVAGGGRIQFVHEVGGRLGPVEGDRVHISVQERPVVVLFGFLDDADVHGIELSRLRWLEYAGARTWL